MNAESVPRKFYVVPSTVGVRMRAQVENEERGLVQMRERERARERERTYVNDFTNERPWDRRRRAGAPSSEWSDRINVNAS